MEAAKYISAAYLAFQSIMFIDLFYYWGQNWAQKYDKGMQDMKYILIITAFVLMGGVIAFNVLNYVWFSTGEGGGCTLNIIINTINVVLIIVYTTV